MAKVEGMTDKRNIVPSIFGIGLLFLWMSCSGKMTTAKPDRLIDKKTMVAVLADIHLTDALAEKKSDNNELKKKQLSHKYLQQILQNYGITEQRFSDSRTYYESLPEEYMEMYSEVSKHIQDKNNTTKQKI